MIPCDSYCTHGGVCLLELYHDGLHDSRFCQWNDDEAISKEEADKRFLMEAKFQDIEPLAVFLIDLENKLR